MRAGTNASHVNQVLNRERNAVQGRQVEARRTPPIRALRGSKRSLRRQGDESMKVFVRLLYPLQKLGHIIDRAERAACQRGARGSRTQIRIVAAGHAAQACWDTAPARS